MNLNLLRNKLSLVLVLLGIGAFSAFSQNDSTKINVTEDVYVTQMDPSTNKDGITDMGVALDETNGDSKETYLKFDLSALAGKGGLVSASLNFSGTIKDGEGYTGIPHLFINVYGCINPWSESTITWDNKVASETEVLAEGDITSVFKYELKGTPEDETAIMNYIVAAMDKHLQFVSFVIKGKLETPNSRMWLSSKAWIASQLVVVQDINLDEPGAVKVFATDITVTGAGNAQEISSDNGTLQMSAVILPVNADFQRVKWSVTNETGQATMSETGLLTARTNGIVTVKADAIDGSWIQGTYEVTISGQHIEVGELSVIKNGFFATEGVTTAWSGDAIVVNGVAICSPPAGGEFVWSWQMNQIVAVALEDKDVPYTFTFKSWADAPRSMSVDFEDSNNGWSKYGVSNSPLAPYGTSDWAFDLTTTPTVYSFDVKFSNMAVNCNQSLQFMLGKSDIVVHIDSVMLTKNTDIALPTTKVFSNSIKVYPNPVSSSNELTVSLSSANVKVAIYNSLGQKMMEKLASGNIVKFNVSSMPKGMYIVKLSDGTSQKFIK